MVVEVAVVDAEREEFTAFFAEAEPRLRRALRLLRGPDLAADATSEALAWAWEHWPRVQSMANPVGYLYRVGISRTRIRPRRLFHATEATGLLTFEASLVPALARLTERQRTAVVLVHGCGWTHQEVADAMKVSRSSVGTHIERGMAQLRKELGADE